MHNGIMFEQTCITILPPMPPQNFSIWFWRCATLCLLSILDAFSLSAEIFFQNQLVRKILSGIPKECQTVTCKDPDQARNFVGPDLGPVPNCLHRLSADNSCKQRVKEFQNGCHLGYPKGII